MPGNVVLAAPTAVLPFTLSKAYQRAKKYEMRVNAFVDGSNLRSSLVVADRSTWSLEKRLNPADTLALWTFYMGQQGPVEAFWFYDWYESGFVYDATGTVTVGRYPVRFQGPLQVDGYIPRSNTQLTLVEIA